MVWVGIKAATRIMDAGRAWGIRGAFITGKLITTEGTEVHRERTCRLLGQRCALIT